MISELGINWNDCFKDFDYSPFAAASLGQVHKAVTNESREIVCKLQYPDMNSAVEADLKQLDVIFKINKNLGPAIGTDQIRKEIAERLRSIDPDNLSPRESQEVLYAMIDSLKKSQFFDLME